mmetsp:Transcript_12186/g.45345  ORF Transcript_12186/g.45345 Transcript_12186/m.45345 type:complete len:358 (+) Transcript_12186:4262-5335(+)
MEPDSASSSSSPPTWKENKLKSKSISEFAPRLGNAFSIGADFVTKTETAASSDCLPEPSERFPVPPFASPTPPRLIACITSAAVSLVWVSFEFWSTALARLSGRLPIGFSFFKPSLEPKPATAAALWFETFPGELFGELTGGTRTEVTVPSTLYTKTDSLSVLFGWVLRGSRVAAAASFCHPSPSDKKTGRLGSVCKSAVPSGSKGGGHTSWPWVIAERCLALLLLPLVAGCSKKPAASRLSTVPSDVTRASGLGREAEGRDASWLTTLRSYGVTGRSGEGVGGLLLLDDVRTNSTAAGSMGAAEPEPSCGIDPTSPGLDEQLPITTRPLTKGLPCAPNEKRLAFHRCGAVLRKRPR